jgi:acetyltransferase-like isoleucine patch superfamily enzyme
MMLRRSRKLSGMIRARLWAVRSRGVTVGRSVVIGRACRLVIEPGARLRIGDRCEIDDGTTLAIYRRGSLELGDSCFVGHHCTLAARQSVRIGRATFLAELVSVRDHEHDPDHPPSTGVTRVAPVTIGSDVWLASKVSVLQGSSIGDGAVVGAHAVVRGDVPASVVAAGIPARVLRAVGVD